VLHKGFVYNIPVNSVIVVLVGSAVGISYPMVYQPNQIFTSPKNLFAWKSRNIIQTKTYD